jgi:hypothetical protein
MCVCLSIPIQPPHRHPHTHTPEQVRQFRAEIARQAEASTQQHEGNYWLPESIRELVQASDPVGMPQNEQGHLSMAASFSTPVGDPHTPSKRTRSRSPIPEAKSENQRLRIDEATGKVYVASVSPASSGLSPSGSPTPKGIFKYIYIYIYICVCVCVCVRVVFAPSYHIFF